MAKRSCYVRMLFYKIKILLHHLSGEVPGNNVIIIIIHIISNTIFIIIIPIINSILFYWIPLGPSPGCLTTNPPCRRQS